jgi:Ca2+-binding EF-hand superfamily protein
MKQIAIYLLSFFTALSVHAQQTTTGSNVTITVNSNRSLQVYIDSKDYNPVNDLTNNIKTTITINNLGIGQHSLLFELANPNKSGSERINTIFNLRYGYDMNIRLNGNGSLELIEIKKTGISVSHIPMNTADFNYLVRNVRNQRSNIGRRTLIVTAFNTSDNYFTTSQVLQLLRLINSENYRLELARLSYPKVTDRNNFNQVYDLLNSQASRNDLEEFINNYTDDSDINTAMSDAEFSALYRSIQQQWPVSAQVSSLTNAFNNLNNNFTSYQASQLIQLVNAENSRLQLARLSYRSITDRNNFSQIYTLLSSQSAKNELAAYVANYNDESNPSIAMSDAEFNTLYRTIQQQWPVSTQVNSLSNAFNNTNYHFTVYQASQLIQLVSAEDNRLQLAKLSYRSITDRNNFNQIYNLLNSQSGKNELAAYINNYGGDNNQHMAMTDANFNSLYQRIQNQWPVTTQMNTLVNTFNNTNYYFSTYQASRLIQLVDGESNRLQLAKLSYRSITDRNNFRQIVDLLSTQSAKNELEAYVNNNSGGGVGNKLPMTDADFNVFYQTLEIQFLPGEQMISLTNAFNNTSYNFTTAQVKKLIPLVSQESNRLRLAKLSYRGITDRNNFFQLYDLLNSQSSRDELDAYVKAYRD